MRRYACTGTHAKIHIMVSSYPSSSCTPFYTCQCTDNCYPFSFRHVFFPQLEKSCNLRVKIFPRDLDAKLPADMNLDHVLEKCSVVVPLLTDAFAKSESCKRASMRARKRHDRGQLVLAPMKITMVDTPEALRTLPKLLFCDPHVKKNALHFLYRMIRESA